MKQIYEKPEISVLPVTADDILTNSFEVSEELFPNRDSE